MYLSHWNLISRPFDDTLDPSCFFPSSPHRGTLLATRSLVERGVPLAVLAGGTGYGKSLMAATVANRLSTDDYLVRMIAVTPRSVWDVLREIVQELDANGNTAGDCRFAHCTADGLVAVLRGAIHRFNQSERHVVLWLDAADGICETELPDLVETLSGLSVEGTGSLSTILVGSTEFMLRTGRIAERMRISVPQIVLGPMPASDSMSYIRRRMRACGGDSTVFARDAVERIHELSGGVPRRINRLCDLALLIACARRAPQVSAEVVWTAQAELAGISRTRTGTMPFGRRWRELTPHTRPCPTK
jgi:general secretion pathway protein A